MDANTILQQLTDQGYEAESADLWSPLIEIEPMDKERDGTLENWRRYEPGQTVQLTIRMSKTYVDDDHETEWTTEVSDELIAFARAAADVARKHGPTFKKEER